ncbi:MAG: KH domain-containing protein, partial [Candidatus Aenigmatarchaeota archaeon]
IPRVGDMVIAQVVDIQSNGWVLEIGAPHDAFMPLSGVREYIDTTKTALSSVYAMDDVLYAKVNSAQGDSIHLSMQDPRARKLRGGRIVKINPAKVPRLIGKAGSMVSMIKNKTDCKINIGQNGLVWFEGGKEELVLKAIEMVEEKAYTDGLTDKISKLLEGGKK